MFCVENYVGRLYINDKAESIYEKLLAAFYNRKRKISILKPGWKAMANRVKVNSPGDFPR